MNTEWGCFSEITSRLLEKGKSHFRDEEMKFMRHFTPSAMSGSHLVLRGKRKGRIRIMENIPVTNGTVCTHTNVPVVIGHIHT